MEGVRYFCMLICAPRLCPKKLSPLTSIQESSLEDRVKLVLDRLLDSKFDTSNGP